MTEAIKAALLTLESPASFAVRRRAPADALHLAVTKVGPVDFPVTSAAVERLLAVASRSPFGQRDQTIVDPSVRSGWQVAKSRVKIDGRRWNPVLRDILDALREQLGAPGRLTATLDKLTIYGPGEFFKTHQDTQKDASMIGTLVVLLPSRFSGGALRIDRQGEPVEFRRTAKAAEQLELLAFYADCHHEVRPVKSGYRVALVYQLGVDHAARRSVADHDFAPAQFESLKRAVEEHFTRPQPVRYAGNGRTFVPEKLVYLLDHQYTPQGLDWATLKHADALRAAALRETAKALDLDIHLALADVHEAWQCLPQHPYGWSRSAQRDQDYELENLIDSDVALNHWQSETGEPVNFEQLTIDDAELCFTTANDELHPFQSDYEGYMGNYGETLDRWYHRAALVVWPKANAFVVEARLNPGAAIRKLIEGFKTTNNDDAARDRLRRLLDVWPTCVCNQPNAQLLVGTLRLALLVDDASLTDALLEPILPGPMPDASVQPLLGLAARYGLDWCQARLAAWHERRWPTLPARPWSTTHPHAWLTKLVHEDPDLGLELARFIAAQQWGEARKWLAGARPARSRSPFRTERDNGMTDAVIEVLRSSFIADAPALQAAIIADLLGEDTRLTALQLATLVDGIHDAPGIDRLADHCRRQLEAQLAKPPRSSGDWSIVIARSCGCADCATLHDFLESNDVRFSWPLAKNRRRHIHGIVERDELPVSHTTQRTGSPHELQLTKTAQLARVEAERRRACKAALVLITRKRGV